MPYKVLLSAPYMLPFQDRFQPVFDHYDLIIMRAEVAERLSETQLLDYAGQFDGALAGDDSYSRRVLMACAPRLKVVSKWGTGIDSIDQEAARELGIMVGNTPNAFTLPVADTVLGYILAYARRGPWMDREIKAGQWKKIPGISLSECSLGVIGVGNIGQAIFRRARVFGMKLLGNDIREIELDFIREQRIEMTSLADLLNRADFVSINVDLNPTSHHLINAQTLAQMKPSAVLINTARGPVIEESALISALQDGTIAGAALDVFEHEPLPHEHPFNQMDNVMLAPHNANSSPAAWERVHWNSIRNLLIGLGLPMDDLEKFKRSGI